MEVKQRRSNICTHKGLHQSARAPNSVFGKNTDSLKSTIVGDFTAYKLTNSTYQKFLVVFIYQHTSHFLQPVLLKATTTTKQNKME